MRIWIPAIGARAREGFEELARLYLDRLAPLLPGSGGKAGVDAPLFRSEQAFWDAVEREKSRTAPLVVLMDERGRQMGSEAFAAWLGRAFDGGLQLIIFAIGPADGWAKQEPRAGDHHAAMKLSLGPMTMPHELARVVLCEQVYRALTILKGHPYHRS
ncbi:MAG: 23S rRNA (pseudouridine(1915)-N(3))-methyltransferase RlmH [Acidobacteriaceae bacterium]